MPNYAALAQTAENLIEGFGRPVILVKLDFGYEDDTKPWRVAADPRLNPEQTLEVSAVFVPLESNIRLGLGKITVDMLRQAEALCLVGSSLDVTQFHELIDSQDQRRYKIKASETLQPGPTRLTTYLVLGR